MARGTKAERSEGVQGLREEGPATVLLTTGRMLGAIRAEPGSLLSES
jgi:hypothetical protein